MAQLIPDGILTVVSAVVVQNVRVATMDKNKVPFPTGPKYTCDLAYVGGKKYVNMTDEAYGVLQPATLLPKMPPHDLVGVLTEESFGGKSFTKFIVVAAVRSSDPSGGAGAKLLVSLRQRQKQEEAGVVPPPELVDNLPPVGGQRR